MRKIVLLCLIIGLVLLVGCKQLVLDDSSKKVEEIKKVVVPIVNKTPAVEAKKEVVKVVKPVLKCTHNSNCTGKQYCIEGSCKLISDYYEKKECSKKCNYQKIKITTSDNEKYELSRGRGGYTAASALEWMIVSGPDYCPGETIKIPFKVLKRNYGKVFADEVVILKVGETSKTITHPLMPEIAFTLRVESVEESCS